MQRKKVYLLTDTFPYGEGEKTFIAPEIEILKKEYEIVIISAASLEMAKQREWKTGIDNEVKVLRFCPEEEKKMLFCCFLVLFWFQKACWIEVKEIMKSHRKIFLRIWKSMYFYAKAESLYCWIRKDNIIDEDEGIYYSYWYNDKVLAMSMHRKLYPQLKIITRAHGYDLFDERMEEMQRQPFKKVMDAGIDKILFVSRYNLNYYVNKLEIDISKKYTIQRIGAPKAMKFPESVERREVFRIVSCSSIIKLKRITLIIDALRFLKDIQIEWVHFGTGNNAQEVEEYAGNTLGEMNNIRFCFKGYVPRDEIYAYYADNYIHCFINVSETEGSPVSMQEALAFGIPLIGTDVGGVSEMIEGNGYLLCTNPSVSEVSESIKKMYVLNAKEYDKMRKRSLEIWKRDYNLKQNMLGLLEMLKQI